jgi:hypothetical protein
VLCQTVVRGTYDVELEGEVRVRGPTEVPCFFSFVHLLSSSSGVPKSSPTLSLFFASPSCVCVCGTAAAALTSPDNFIGVLERNARDDVSEAHSVSVRRSPHVIMRSRR